MAEPASWPLRHSTTSSNVACGTVVFRDHVLRFLVPNYHKKQIVRSLGTMMRHFKKVIAGKHQKHAVHQFAHVTKTAKTSANS